MKAKKADAGLRRKGLGFLLDLFFCTLLYSFETGAGFMVGDNSADIGDDTQLLCIDGDAN